MKPYRIRFLYAFVALALFAAAAGSPASAAEPKNCSTAKDCATGEFCDTTPKCPGGKTKGVCAKKPQFCTEDYSPVTGCNGKEYSNRCHAAVDGQPNTGPVKK